LVDRVYDISDFEWVAEENTFYNHYDYVIYDISHRPNYSDSRRQFYILNPKTNNRHRFRFKEQIDGYNLFVSETGFSCKIKLKNK
jgi:hypothetical protein